jgi:predicted cupin superfamily sugar epimerase
MNVKDIKKYFNMKKHVEGGYYSVLHENGKQWNSIYYLIPKGEICMLHRLNINELWNFYLGGPLELYSISPDGVLDKTTLGTDLLKGHQVAHVMPKDYWFGAIPAKGTDYSLVSCVCSPSFTFANWEKGTKFSLTSFYPEHADIIERLTK